MRGMLNQLEPLTDGSFRMTRSWWSFFAQQFGPQPVQTITPTGSPFILKAPTYRGVLMVSGGTVSRVEYSLDGTVNYPTGQTQGCFPMAGGDQQTITYSAAPTLTYIAI